MLKPTKLLTVTVYNSMYSCNRNSDFNSSVYCCICVWGKSRNFSNIARTRLRQRSYNTCIEMLWNA